jgi:hypothetical protein
MILSEPLHRQYDRRQVKGRMIEPTYQRVMQRAVMVHYQVHTEVARKGTYLLTDDVIVLTKHVGLIVQNTELYNSVHLLVNLYKFHTKYSSTF